MESSSQSHEIEVGLKSLTLCCPNNNDQKLHHNSCIMASNLMSPPSSPALSHIGDYIGMESCLDMQKCEDVQMMNVNASTTTMTTPTLTQHVRSSRSSCSRKSRTKKAMEFPPPISLLARTENLPCHMPFVWKRYYTNDGRLILREERVRRHEYLRAHRSNGHLTLQLVHLDGNFDDDDDDDDDALFPHFPPFDDGNENEHKYAQELAEERAVAEVEAKAGEEEIEGLISQIPESSNDNEGIGGMCLNYNNVILSSSCYLGVPVPAVKPVQT